MTTTGYDWRRTVYKAAKTGAVAAVAFVLASPDLTELTNAILGAIPANYRVMAAIAMPMLLSALRNWLKNSPSV